MLAWAVTFKCGVHVAFGQNTPAGPPPATPAGPAGTHPHIAVGAHVPATPAPDPMPYAWAAATAPAFAAAPNFANAPMPSFHAAPLGLGPAHQGAPMGGGMMGMAVSPFHPV